jgi:hypothetical protein
MMEARAQRPEQVDAKPHSRQAKISFRDVNIGFMETALLKINCNNQVAI